MKGMRVSRSTSRHRAVLGVAALSLLLVVFVFGCGTGGEDTTSTAVTAAPGSTSTASSIVTSSSDMTPTSGGITSTSGGITISIPSTESTAASTTTTEALSSAETRLANGHIKAMGFIDRVYVEGGKRYIRIDYAEMLTGAAAIAAAIAAGDIEPGEDLPNDYYISNLNPQKRVFEVSNTGAITTSTRWVPGEDMGASCAWNDFNSFWGPPAGLDDMEKHLKNVPWWIERDGPIVLKIDEQYLP